MTVPRAIPRVLLALLLAIAALWVAANREQINTAGLGAWIDQLGSWSLIGYVAVYALATVMWCLERYSGLPAVRCSDRSWAAF
jgi:uncharacterized membrane protein YdjX (TVP38/TMEM64 family)